MTKATVIRILRTAAFLIVAGLIFFMYQVLPKPQFLVLSIVAMVALIPLRFVVSLIMDVWSGNVAGMVRKSIWIGITIASISALSVFLPQLVEKTQWLKTWVLPQVQWVQNAWNGIQTVQGISGTVNNEATKAQEVTYVYVLFEKLPQGCSVTVTSNQAINIRRTPDTTSDNNIVQKGIVAGTPLIVIAQSIVQDGPSWLMLPDQTVVRSDLVSKPPCITA